jgi:hypothetical protein
MHSCFEQHSQSWTKCSVAQIYDSLELITPIRFHTPQFRCDSCILNPSQSFNLLHSSKEFSNDVCAIKMIRIFEHFERDRLSINQMLG